VSAVTSWMFTKLRSSFTQKPERNSRATIERVALRRNPFAASSVCGATHSPTTTVPAASTIPAPITCSASCASDSPEARSTVISDCSDMRARAKSVPMRPAAGSNTYACEGSIRAT